MGSFEMATPERDALAIGMPSRAQISELAEKFRRQLSWRFSVKFHEIDFGYSYDILQGRAVEQNPRTVRRPPRATAKSGDLTFGATQRGYDNQSASITLGTENQARAVRRPIRLPVVCRRGRHLHWIAFADRLNPDVEIAASI